jgi:uncharacterized protein YkwD
MNVARQCYSARPLMLDVRLQRCAQWMANHIATKGYIEDNPHMDWEGHMPWERAWQEDFPQTFAVAENLVMNLDGVPKDTSKQVALLEPDWLKDEPIESTELWLCSKPHRESLVNDEYTHCGMAYASGLLPNMRSVVCAVYGGIPDTGMPDRVAVDPKCAYRCKDGPKEKLDH